MADKAEFLQAIDDAILDADSLEKFINGSDSETVLTRLSAKYPTLQNAIKQMFKTGGVPAVPFASKADMDSAVGDYSDGDYAVVVDDSEDLVNGYYQKQGGSWVYLKYNPIENIKKVVDIDNANTGDIVIFKDVNGEPVFSITRDGKVYMVGLDEDLKSAINSYSKLVDVEVGEGGFLFVGKDSNGATTLAQSINGDLLLPRVGNITQTVLNLSSRSSAAKPSLSLESARMASKYSDNVLAELAEGFEYSGELLTADQVNAANIFNHNVYLVRIPAITRLAKTKFILFFEARESGGDFDNVSLGTAIIDIDLSTPVPDVSLSNMTSLHDSFTDAEGKLRTFMNPCGVLLDSGRIISTYVRRHGRGEHELYTRYSDNGGITWSDFEDISYIKDAKALNLLCPCSQGHVLRHGKHKGRIVFPAWTTGANYVANEYRAGFIYSDDDGLTWSLGKFTSYPQGNEVQCAEDLNGDLLFSIRLEHHNPPKVLARYSHETQEYTNIPIENNQLTSDAIMSGLIQGDNRFDRSNPKFQIVSCKSNKRTGMRIGTSYDGGKTWEVHDIERLEGKPVSYSCIENISPTHKLLVWEEPIPAWSASAAIKFNYSIISIKNLLNEDA